MGSTYSSESTDGVSENSQLKMSVTQSDHEEREVEKKDQEKEKIKETCQ